MHILSTSVALDMAKVHTYLQHESLYRGDDAVKKRAAAEILLCGGGALGSWLADLLARQGYWGLTVLDMDKVEDSNFGTQMFGKADTGRSKAAQISANIFRRIGVKVWARHKKVTESNVTSIVKGYNLVVDLFDNTASRRLLHQACLDKKAPCLHAGTAAMGFFEVRWNEDYIVPRTTGDLEDAPCEYPMAANLVMMCVAATAESVNRFIDNGEKLNSEFWLKPMSLETMV